MGRASSESEHNKIVCSASELSRLSRLPAYANAEDHPVCLDVSVSEKKEGTRSLKSHIGTNCHCPAFRKNESYIDSPPGGVCQRNYMHAQLQLHTIIWYVLSIL